jgi:hypothetical protein
MCPKNLRPGRFIMLMFSFSANIVFSQIPANQQSHPNVDWGIQFGTTGEEYSLNHVADRSGNLYVCGKTAGSMEGINAGKNDGFITKISKFLFNQNNLICF